VLPGGRYPGDGTHATWTRVAPTLADVWARFNAADKLEEDSLYAALDSLTSFQIFEPNGSKPMNLLDVAKGVAVINLSGYDTKSRISWSR